MSKEYLDTDGTLDLWNRTKSKYVWDIAWDTTPSDPVLKKQSGINGQWSTLFSVSAMKTALALTKADVGLGNVDNTSDANKPISTAQQAALDLKAPLASPALTGNPTAPTQSTSDDSTKIATTAFVHDVIDGLSTGVTGVKGDAESTYRTGQVNLTPANLGITVFPGATGSADGDVGLVPKPLTGETTKLLWGDGYWKQPRLHYEVSNGNLVVKLQKTNGSGYSEAAAVTIPLNSIDPQNWSHIWPFLDFDTTEDEYFLQLRYGGTPGTVDGSWLLASCMLPAATTTTRGMMRASDKVILETLWNDGDYQSDWNQSDSTAADYIKNKPTIPTVPGDFTGATSDDPGAHGLVPAPVAGEDDSILWGDGDWEELAIGTTYFDNSVSVELQHGAGSSYDSASLNAATSSLAGVMSATDKAKLDALSDGGCWYGTSSTAATTAAKIVACSGFTLKKGSIIAVLFGTANTAGTPTLDVNSTGAKSIRVGNATPNSTTNVLKWSANTLIFFMYDGTAYKYLNAVAEGAVTPPRGANTWYGFCESNRNASARTVAIDNFVLTKGAVVVVRMKYAQEENAALTLNVNSTGAKPIYLDGQATSTSNGLWWHTNDVITFVYDGSNWVFAAGDFYQIDGLVQQGAHKLSAALQSYIRLSNTAQSATEVSDRVYPVALDSNGDLAVNVPWSDTTYSDATTSASGLMSSSDKTKLNKLVFDNSDKIDSSILPSYVDDVIEGYPVSGATELSAGWLSATSGGSALTPESGKIYVLMTATTNYNVGDEFRWTGTAYAKIADSGLTPISSAWRDANLV